MKNILLVVCLMLIPLSSGALELGNDIDEDRIVSIETPEPPLNESNLSVGIANKLNTTSLGLISDFNTSQFTSVGGTLTAITSYWDGFWCSVFGCTMQGDIAFDTTSRKIAGIDNGNLVSKTADEVITGNWDFTKQLDLTGSGSNAKLRFMGTAGGGNAGSDYTDSGGSQRLWVYINNDIVRIVNRAANSKVILAANTGTAGSAGEVDVLEIEATQVTSNTDFKIGNFRELMLCELDSNGGSCIDFRAPSAIAAGSSYLWPGADGSNSQFLRTAGNGILSWNFIELLADEKLFMGAASDVSLQFDGNDFIINAEVGNPNMNFTGFNSYNFDNDTFIEGDLIVSQNITLSNGGKLWDNSTCLFLASPDGTTVQEICNV